MEGKNSEQMIWCGVIVSLMALSCTGGDDMEDLASGSKTTENPAAEGKAADTAGLFNEAVFKKEKSAWEAQGLCHYRFLTTFVADAIYWGPSAEITVFPDREPKVVIHSKEPWEPFYGETIDVFYAFIADKVTRYEKDYLWDLMSKIQYNQEYHYPEYYFSYLIPRDGGSAGGGYMEIKITEFEVLGW